MRVRSDYVNKPPLNLTMDDDLDPVCHDAVDFCQGTEQYYNR